MYALGFIDQITLIIANGFSCKTQLADAGLGRKALHVAEVMKIARDLADPRLKGVRPERLAPRPPRAPVSVRAARAAALAVLSAAALGGAYRLFKKSP